MGLNVNNRFEGQVEKPGIQTVQFQQCPINDKTEPGPSFPIRYEVQCNKPLKIGTGIVNRGSSCILLVNIC